MRTTHHSVLTTHHLPPATYHLPPTTCNLQAFNLLLGAWTTFHAMSKRKPDTAWVPSPRRPKSSPRAWLVLPRLVLPRLVLPRLVLPRLALPRLAEARGGPGVVSGAAGRQSQLA